MTIVIKEVDAIITRHKLPDGEEANSIIPAGNHKNIIKLEYNPFTQKVLVYKKGI